MTINRPVYHHLNRLVGAVDDREREIQSLSSQLGAEVDVRASSDATLSNEINVLRNAITADTGRIDQLFGKLANVSDQLSVLGQSPSEDDCDEPTALESMYEEIQNQLEQHNADTATVLAEVTDKLATMDHLERKVAMLETQLTRQADLLHVLAQRIDTQALRMDHQTFDYLSSSAPLDAHDH